jgi:hypothetical protein
LSFVTANPLPIISQVLVVTSPPSWSSTSVDASLTFLVRSGASVKVTYGRVGEVQQTISNALKNSGTYSMRADLLNLEALSKYEYKITVTNAQGTSTSGARYFTTPTIPPKPVVQSESCISKEHTYVTSSRTYYYWNYQYVYTYSDGHKATSMVYQVLGTRNPCS